DSIEVNHAIAVGWLDSATECLIRDVGAGRANLRTERGINAAGIGMPNVDRGIRHWLARIGVNNPKSEASRQAGGSGGNVPARQSSRGRIARAERQSARQHASVDRWNVGQ